MFARVNKNNKTAFAGNSTPSMGVFYSVPMKGARAGHRLTIKSNGQRVDLTLSQITSLEKVISKARRLAKKS
jgi:hypothetical protein